MMHGLWTNKDTLLRPTTQIVQTLNTEGRKDHIH